jgi:hypothetical protein
MYFYFPPGPTPHTMDARAADASVEAAGNGSIRGAPGDTDPDAAGAYERDQGGSERGRVEAVAPPAGRQ